MPHSDKITIDPASMGGAPCIRGTRVTVGTIVGLIASGATQEEILADYLQSHLIVDRRDYN